MKYTKFKISKSQLKNVVKEYFENAKIFI